MSTQFPIPPTYTLPFIKDGRSEEFVFNPIWLQWFLDLARILTIANVTPTGFDHQALGELQGGSATDRWHLTEAERNSVVEGPAQPVATPAVGASPWAYQNTSGFTQILIFAGGAGVTYEYSQDGAAYTAIPATGWFVLGRGHYFRTTYGGAPTLTTFCI